MSRRGSAIGIGLGVSLVMVLGVLAPSGSPQPADAARAKAAAPPSKTSFKRAKVTITQTDEGKAVTDRAGYVLYIFSSDKPNKRRSSRCYGRCAKLWPPLLTKKRPKALGTAKQGKLGVTKRRNGSKQVTYAGRPLYYYEHEPSPGIAGCHDVFLNGGFWYAIKASGKRLP